MGDPNDDGWFVRDSGNDTGYQIWRIADGKATRMDVSNPEQGPGTYFAADAGETIWDAIRRQTPWLEGQPDPGPFVRMNRDPGQYHPRIARPLVPQAQSRLWLPDAAREERYIASAQNQLQSLVAELQSICRVVQPAPATLSVYGHEIRNLLILAATEVEMHWRGVLVANGNAAKMFKTKDYVKLIKPLKLNEFSVRFQACPDIGPFAPFALWDQAKPSQSLDWYEAYHGVKHNREHEFERASLGNGFAAIAACAVMLVAQFGEHALTADLGRFLIVDSPAWPVEERYLACQGQATWTPQPHPILS